jgi:hypothetical protein
MSTKTRGRIRTLFAVPSAALLVFGATELLAAPAPASRLPDCADFCANTGEAYCAANPSYTFCRYCGLCFGW